MITVKMSDCGTNGTFRWTAGEGTAEVGSLEIVADGEEGTVKSFSFADSDIGDGLIKTAVFFFRQSGQVNSLRFSPSAGAGLNKSYVRDDGGVKKIAFSDVTGDCGGEK